MPAPLFRLVAVPAALNGTPASWAADMLRDGEVAVLVDEGGLDAIDAVARAIDATAIAVVRTEPTPEQQERTVMAHADGLALIWVAGGFSDEARAWATKRAPMTLLVEATGPLPDDERHRIERFIRILGGQAA
ncbi:hypothetical protein [Patulibacter defluvii]|uniref:hypothetical protein n=1 Tax=Patulibacter defluvii TaxID=3095358 RepID=UPI002A753B56|nr:hypothetical protein [Patulibacter sp. DM4]